MWIGVRTYDAIENKYFNLRAALLWIINDFPAYGTLSYYSTKGYKACLVCLHDTASARMRSKITYMGHQRFLDPSHPWRANLEYDGTIKKRLPPKFLFGDEILVELNNFGIQTPRKHLDVVVANEERKKKEGYNGNWTHKFILWEIEY